MAIEYGTVAAVQVTEQPRYGQTASGYGSKVPTRYKVRLADDQRWRRVYAMVYGNSGSIYVQVKGRDVFLDEIEIEHALLGVLILASA